MNYSSQGQLFTITLDEEQKDPHTMSFTSDIPALTALTSSDIITLTSTDFTTSSYTTSNLSTIDLTSIESFSTLYNPSLEFDGMWPAYHRVQEMCKEYPGLEIAYRKFKEVYKMVKEDYDGKLRERNSRKI